MTAPPPRDRATSWRQVVETLGNSTALLLSAAAIAGFALVSLSRMGLNWFYSHFGLVPEDVGLDQGAILFRTAATATVVVVASTIIGAVAAAAIDATVRASRGEGMAGALRAAISLERRVVAVAGAVTLVLLLAFWVWGVVTARDSLERIRAGASTGPQLIAHGEITATCVAVWWSPGHLDDVFAAAPGSEFVYLGRSEQIGVFYDARTDRTLRVPIVEVATATCE